MTRFDPAVAARAVTDVETLPERFLRWQIDSRLEAFEKLVRGDHVGFLASHLPVLASVGGDGTINLANKGVGLMPRPERLAHYLGLVAETVEHSAGRPWRDSLPRRIETACELLRHPEDVDGSRLGSLEIFEGRTFSNLKSSPSAALLYTGEGPEYMSYQIDVHATVVHRDNPVYDFLVASRRLFEHDCFHVPQPGYPFGYEFVVTGYRDKTPVSRFQRPSQERT